MLKAKSKKKPVQTLAELLKSDPDALKTTHPIRLALKAPLPGPDEKPAFGLVCFLPVHIYFVKVTDKDYVNANAVEIIHTQAKHPCCNEKDYLCKSDYGKIPKYIQRIKKDIEKENEYIAAVKREEEAAEQAKKRLLTSEERAALLNSLKGKWEEVNSEYQQITHMTVLETLSKVHRKERFESELKQIEKDMDLMKRKEDIWIDLER